MTLIPLRKNTKRYRKNMYGNKKELTKEQKEKAKFRQTAVWKNFRNMLKKQRKVDFLTGKPLRAGFQVHHCDLNPEHYKNLDPDDFYTLSRSSHEYIHWGFRYPDWEFLLLRTAHVWLQMDKLNNKTTKTGKQKKLDTLFEQLYYKIEKHEEQM